MKLTNTITKTLIGAMIIGSAFANNLQIRGSDTMVNLGQKLAEAYGKENPGSNISVTGGGSGTGIAALTDKNVDIGNASRKIKEKEIKRAKANGVDIKEFVIAIDALSVIVNPENKINSLTLEQIGKIFRGEVTNWKEVGGENRQINLYGRQSNSGTFSFFREFVLMGDYSDRMNRMNGNSQIVESVRNDISGIGYVGVGYVNKNGKPVDFVKALNISEKKGILKFLDKTYSPFNKEDVFSGNYPIARGLNMYTNGKPSGLTKSFIEFTVSPKGQKIVEEVGFYEIGSKEKQQNDENL